MKIIARSVPVKLGGRTWVCDIILGAYMNSLRPAITLVESQDSTFMGEPVAVISTNVRPEYYTGMSFLAFSVKNWTENEGIEEQMLTWKDEQGEQLFRDTGKAFTVGYASAPVYEIASSSAIAAFDELLLELEG